MGPTPAGPTHMVPRRRRHEHTSCRRSTDSRGLVAIWFRRAGYPHKADCGPRDCQGRAAVKSVGIGTSPQRVGGYDRVTGGQQYVADIRLQDVLHVKLVALDCARARIVSIDTSAAEQVPGVRLVMTAADLPQPVPRFGPQFEDRPVIAVGETKYHGEPVAAVAAEATSRSPLRRPTSWSRVPTASRW